MIRVAVWIMALATWRDRVAMAMTFILPALLFLVFAAIFAGVTGRELRLKVGVIDSAQTETTKRFAKALSEEPSLRVSHDATTTDALKRAVDSGLVDVGIVLRGDLAERPEQGPPPILVIEDPTRPLAAAIVTGQAQRTLNEKMPQVALARILSDVEASGAIGPDEREFLDDAFKKQEKEKSASGFSFARIVEVQRAGRASSRHAGVLHYAAAVVAVFLLFAASHGALTLLDERRGGIAQRLSLNRGGMTAIVAGKQLFLTAQGVIQALVVFAVAYAVFDANVPLANAVPFLITCILTAFAAASIGLAIVALSTSRKQAEGATTFIVLLVSAIGGSMVPRYLMPPWLQSLGWFTPNAWMIRAFEVATQADPDWSALAGLWAVLLAASMIASCVAIMLSIRRTRYSFSL